MKSLKLKVIASLAVVMFLFCNNTFAQDKIYKKYKRAPIEAKVLEIGTSEIKYQLYGDEADGLVYVSEKEVIEKIEFENGKTERFGESNLERKENFIGQKTKALKVSFLGPLIGTTKFSYEQNVKPGRSWEIKATMVGMGINQDIVDGVGIFGSVGYKFFHSPTYVTSDLRRNNIMQGAYLKPEFFFGGYTSKQSDGNKKTYGGAGVLVNLGKQWVFGEKIVFDISAGMGYGGGESRHGYFIFDNVVAAGTMNVGFLF